MPSGRAGLTLGALNDDIPRAEGLVKTVAAELDALNVELQAPPRVTLLEPAAMGQTNNRKRKIMAAGVAGGGTLASGAAFRPTRRRWP